MFPNASRNRPAVTVTAVQQTPTGPATSRFSWGLLDTFVVWGTGFFVAAFTVGVMFAAGVLTDGPRDDRDLTAWGFSVVLLVQNATMLVAAWIVARLRGSGSLTRDFGLRIAWRDGGWLLVGLGLQVAALVALIPIAELAGADDAPQEAVQRLEDAGGAQLALLGFGVVVVAPVVEELVFRGLLLRSLLRRMSPGWAVAVSSGLFGLVHLADPGAAVVVPGLVALGVVTGIEATRTGSLSRPILLHAGFNLLTVVILAT